MSYSLVVLQNTPALLVLGQSDEIEENWYFHNPIYF